MIHVLAIFIGLMAGSFLSVLIPRLHNEEKGILMGRSHCNNCKNKLNAKELIPVISFLLQKGLCRNCNQKIPIYYPIMELSSAAVFLWMSFHFDNPMEIWISSILMWILLYIFFHDLIYKEIHDAVMIPAIMTAFLSSFIIGDPYSSIVGALGALNFFGIQFLATKGKWLGSGDMLIGTFIGLLLGWKLTILAIFLGYLSGSIFGISMIIIQKADKKTALPLGPFLVLGSMIAVEYGNTLINLYFGI